MGKYWKVNKPAMDKLERRFKSLPKAVVDDVNTAMINNAKEAVEIVRGDAPQGPTGNLKRAVRWIRGNPPSGLYKLDRYDPKPSKSKRVSIYVSNTIAPHAHLVHNGTQKRSTKSGANRGIATPLPFFWPNIRSLRRRHLSRMSRAATKAAKRIFNR
jgi:hypothetical protein